MKLVQLYHKVEILTPWLLCTPEQAQTKRNRTKYFWLMHVVCYLFAVQEGSPVTTTVFLVGFLEYLYHLFGLDFLHNVFCFILRGKVLLLFLNMLKVFILYNTVSD